MPNAFLKNWLVVSFPGFESPPSFGDREALKKAFETEVLDSADNAFAPVAGDAIVVRGVEYRWRLLTSVTNEVDLVTPGAQNDYAIAYAWTEVVADRATETVLGIGSDDSVKVWLNGAPAHEKFIGRPVTVDDDLVKVTLQPGVNRILLKIQNETASWGFACRFVDHKGLTEDLGAAAMAGIPERVRELIGLGADVNAEGLYSATALQLARIYGQQETAATLIDRGAARRQAGASPESLVDALFREKFGEAGDPVPGATVLVSKGGEILFARGYGFANLSDRVPATPETKFRIGSITKQFVAAGILALQEEGKLTVEDTLDKFVPDFPRGDEITLRHLLTHTSGMQSFTDKPNFAQTAPLYKTSEQMIETFKNDPFAFSPGDRWAYNNSGYFLLGVVIEKVAAMPYGDYLKQRFFDPLGMTDTGAHTSSAILTHEAIGYSFEHGQYRKAINWDMSQAGGAGSLYSTVLDLFRWNEALFNGKALSPASTGAAWTPVVLSSGRMPSGSSSGYGYGWVSQAFRGLERVQHSGGLHGFLSHISRFTDDDFTVVVLQNASPALTNPAGLARDIAQIFLGEKMAPYESAVPAVDPDKSFWPRFAGRYDAGGGAILQIEYVDGALTDTSTGLTVKLPLIATSDCEFIWPNSHDRITFSAADRPEDDTAVRSQGGAVVTLYRLTETQQVAVDKPTLARCAGKYNMHVGVDCDVASGNNSLLVTIPGQPVFSLYPKSDTEYFARDFDLHILFQGDIDGKRATMIATYGGQRFEASRVA